MTIYQGIPHCNFMFKKIGKLIDDQIIRHFRDSRAPVSEVALGGMIGMFWAMTPLIGIQMAFVIAQWLFMKALGIRFYLPIGIAMVWLTNPITMPFFYYSFYMVGATFFEMINSQAVAISFERFSQVLQVAQEMQLWSGIIAWGKFMLFELGWPMLTGGFIIGVPLSLAFYPLTAFITKKHRRKLAEKEGISMEEWNKRHVRSS